MILCHGSPIGRGKGLKNPQVWVRTPPVVFGDSEMKREELTPEQQRLYDNLLSQLQGYDLESDLVRFSSFDEFLTAVHEEADRIKANMRPYDLLPESARHAVNRAFAVAQGELFEADLVVSFDDRAERLVDAIATYVVESGNS